MGGHVHGGDGLSRPRMSRWTAESWCSGVSRPGTIGVSATRCQCAGWHPELEGAAWKKSLDRRRSGVAQPCCQTLCSVVSLVCVCCVVTLFRRCRSVVCCPLSVICGLQSITTPGRMLGYICSCGSPSVGVCRRCRQNKHGDSAVSSRIIIIAHQTSKH